MLTSLTPCQCLQTKTQPEGDGQVAGAGWEGHQRFQVRKGDPAWQDPTDLTSGTLALPWAEPGGLDYRKGEFANLRIKAIGKGPRRSHRDARTEQRRWLPVTPSHLPNRGDPSHFKAKG